MIDFILFVSASTLSGSLMLLLIEMAGRLFETKIGPGKMYLLLKISLAYFFLPGVVLVAWLVRMYTYESNSMPHEEIAGYYIIHYFTDLAIGRQLTETPVWAEQVFVIWLAGAVVSMGIHLYKGIQFRRLRKFCKQAEDKKILEAAEKAAFQCQIGKKIQIEQCSYINSPFLYGLFLPKVIVAMRELREEEWEMVFLHEFIHYKSRDTLFRQVVGIVQGFHWFNPLIYRFAQLFQEYGELACDERVSQRLPSEKKGQYARLLVKLAQYAGQVSNTAAFSNNRQKFFERRIRIIMRKETMKRRVFSAILTIAIAGFFCPVAAYASSLGTLTLYNEITEKEFEETDVEEVYVSYEYTEQVNYGKLLPDDGILVKSLTRGTNLVDFTLSGGTSTIFTEEKISAGGTIRIAVSGEKTSDQFNVGIIGPSGPKRYVRSQNGAVYHTFDISETGMYEVYFENTGDSSIRFSGTVYIN